MPSISILTPVYNAEAFIAETIGSILGQTFEDFELLLLDDGSTDASEKIIKSYQDDRIRYFKRPHNFIKTLNFGLQIARGEYIALLDHDDIMVSNRLELQYNFMKENSDVVACGGCIDRFGMQTGILKPPFEYEEIMIEMSVRSPMYNPTGFIRTQAIRDKNLLYRDGYSFAADYKLWSDIVKVGKVVNMPEVLTLYRTYETQTSRLYFGPSSIGAMKIRMEIVNYILSCFNGDDETFEFLNNSYIPTLNFLIDAQLIPLNLYFQLNYNVLRNLYKCNKLQFPHSTKSDIYSTESK